MAQRTDDPGNAQPNAAAATRAGNPLQGDHLTFTGAEITIGADNAPRIHHFAAREITQIIINENASIGGITGADAAPLTLSVLGERQLTLTGTVGASDLPSYKGIGGITLKRGAKLTLAPGGTFTIQDISTENGPASLKIGSGVEICIGDFKFIFEEECQVTYDSSSNGHFNYHLCNLATTHNISITGHTSDAPPAYSE